MSREGAVQGHSCTSERQSISCSASAARREAKSRPRHGGVLPSDLLVSLVSAFIKALMTEQAFLEPVTVPK